MARPKLVEERAAARSRLEAAREALSAAESAAGIADAMGEGDFTPEDDEHREIVFAIPDCDMRRRVIAANGALDVAFLEAERAELRVMQEDARNDGNRTRTNHLVGAVVFAVVVVLIAYTTSGILAAIVAAVVSALIGFSHLQKAERTATEDTAAARELAREQEDYVDKLEGDTPLFSELEEQTGAPDEVGKGGRGQGGHGRRC